MTELSPFDELQKPPLNEGQQKAHDRIIQYVTGEGENLPRITLIQGYAGTGKTFTVNRIIETLKAWSNKQKYDKKLCIAATAPTHKAVRVMRKNAELGSDVMYATLHSLLKLKPKNDEKTGKKIFVRSTDPADGKGEANVIFVDEVSMLGDKSQKDPHGGKDEEIGLWSALLEVIEEDPSIKLILLGDPVQIPPVNEVDSPVFLDPTKYGIEVLELTQSMRQAGDHPILDYATEIRNTYKNRTIGVTSRLVNDTGIQTLAVMDTSDIDEILEKLFGSSEFAADADHMKVIAWTNTTVDAFNNKIRRMLYSVPEGMLSLPLLMNGEKLILDERYLVPETNGFALPTNEELEVVSYEVVKKAIRYKIWTPIGYSEKSINPQMYKTKARFRTIKGQWQHVLLYIIHERSVGEVKAMMEAVKKSCFAAPFGMERTDMWKHFFVLDGIFAKIKYNYAVTAHKSQGSTYMNCMLIMWDIIKNPRMEEKNRIIYVGATRAKSMLYIVQ